MATQTLAQAGPTVDPIERLIARGAKARQLVNLFPYRAHWLAEHQDDTFRLCFHDESGNVVMEQVDAMRLLTRAEELGWSPDLEGGDGMDGYLFTQAPYSVYRGVHYYASAYDEDVCLPLCLPPSAIAAAVARNRRQWAAAARKIAAERKRKARAEAKGDRTRLLEAKRNVLQRWTEDEIRRAKEAGAPISRTKATKLAKAALKAFCGKVTERFSALHAGMVIGESA